jgi:short-subunit dehydrogenase
MNANAQLVLITGASSGIGQALAAEYARQGWRLALLARRGDALRDWAAEQGLGEDRCAVYAVDVADTAAVLQAARDCLARQGVPDVVIANAGVSMGVDSAEAEDIEVMAQTLAINNVGLMATFSPFIAPMRARGSGTLVGVASVAAIRGLPGHAAYCASKAAVVAYCESLRGELRGSGVRVVTLLPGYVKTPLTARNRYPMPFLLEADDFARRALKAIAAQASYRVIPWPMQGVAWLLRALPNAWFDAFFARQPRKHRHRADPHADQ